MRGITAIGCTSSATGPLVTAQPSEVRVFVGVGRRAAAKKPQVFFGADRVPRAGWNQNGIACNDLAGFARNFDFAASFEDIVKLFAELVVMPLGFAAGRYPSFREALLFDGRIRAIKDRTNGRSVFCRKRRLRFEILNGHGADD